MIGHGHTTQHLINKLHHTPLQHLLSKSDVCMKEKSVWCCYVNLTRMVMYDGLPAIYLGWASISPVATFRPEQCRSTN